MEKISRPFLSGTFRAPGARSIVVTTVLAASAAALSALSHPAALRIDGERMVSDVPPVTTAKGAYVPLRIVAQSFGAETSYDPKTGTVELVRANDTLRLHVGDRQATFNGRKLTLKAAPFSIRGRTMVALSTVASTFRTKVRYEPARANIDVMTTGADDPGPSGDTP